MDVHVVIPTVFREHTNGSKEVMAAGETVGEVLLNLEVMHPGIHARMVTDGSLRRFMNIYVNDSDVRFSGSLDTEVVAGDSIIILPAVAGGR